MNTENEKRWFVYIGDHHEGPLSAGEVFDRKQKGQVTPESYVWREGMADWLMLSQVQELNQALEALNPPADSVSETPAATESTPKVEPTEEAESQISMKSVKKSKNIDTNDQQKKRGGILGKLFFALISLIGFLGVLGIGVLAIGSRTSDTSLHSRIRPIIQQIVEKAPFLRPVFRFVPTLSDIKPQELTELESTRNSSYETEARIGIALSNADPNRPAFYVSTNLPHRTRFDVILVGESETLLNRLQFSAQNTLVTSNGLGKSETFLMDGGQPIPKGEYTVHVFESAEQEEAIKNEIGSIAPSKPQGAAPAGVPASTRFLVSKKYFLGGDRDETYLTRLKAFHESIKEKADKELAELRQFTETLILQQNSMTSEFQKIFRAKKSTPAIKAQWKKISTAWIQISGQLDQAIQTWSPETLQNEFFYGKVYGLVKSAFVAMQSLFKSEIDFIEKPQDKAAFEIQHGKLVSDARDALDQLKTKMELILKAPKTPGGLPTKGGL
jgi:hypothetical protein